MSRPSFVERLWPGPLGWSFVAGFGVFGFVALLPASTTAAVVGAVVATLAGVVVAVGIAVPIRVEDGELRVGRAHIPVTDLGEGRELDRPQIREALGPGSDARTFACVRAWIPTAVVIAVVDPRDPTPAWLVSTRRPAALLEALGQAAHSVQTS